MDVYPSHDTSNIMKIKTSLKGFVIIGGAKEIKEALNTQTGNLKSKVTLEEMLKITGDQSMIKFEI